MADPLNAYSWYHGRLSRVECENVLNKNDRPGLFLVRASNTIVGDYVLSVRELNKVRHYIINFNKNSKVYKIGDQTFDDLPSIVEFYKKHLLDTTTLVEPASRPGSEKPQPPVTESIKVKAKYNFVGSDPEDLSFKKGDILTIIKKEEDDWWLARHSNGQEGLIPKPYVEEISNLQSSTRQSYPAHSTGHDIPGGRHSTGGKDYSQPFVHQTRPQEPLIPTLPSGPLMARAKQSRDPSFYDKTQLKFQKDDRIRVLRRNDDGIWEGENLENGEKGLFPFTFVEILRDQS